MRSRAVAWAVSATVLLAGCGSTEHEAGPEPSDVTVPVVASGRSGHQTWAPGRVPCTTRGIPVPAPGSAPSKGWRSGVGI